MSAMDGEVTLTSSFCAGLLIDAFRAAMGPGWTGEAQTVAESYASGCGVSRR